MSDTLSIIDFCEKHSIAWFPIKLQLVDTGKTQNGEIKYKKELCAIEHKSYSYSRPKSTDFKTLPIETIKARQQLLSISQFDLKHIAIDTSKVFQVDYDIPKEAIHPEYQSMYSGFKCLTPYFKSATKSYGLHAFITTDAKISDKAKWYETEHGDIEVLANGWSYAPSDAVVENADDEIQHLSTVDFNSYIKLESKKQPQPVVTVTRDHDKNKYYNLVCRLSNTQIGGHDEWLKLTAWFATHFTKEEYMDFVSPSFHADADSMWDSIIHNLRPVDIHYICNLAKKVNPAEYKEWRIEFCQYVKIDVLDGGANDVAKYFANKLKNIIVYCKDAWIYYNKSTCLWIQSKNPDAIIISFIQDEIDQAREMVLAIKNKTDVKEDKDKLEKLHDEYVKHRRLITSGSYVTQLKKYLSEYIREDNFRDKLNFHPYKIAFKNGILDLETLTFRAGLKQDDYLTKTVQHDWREPTEAETTYVRESLKKICNYNDTHLAYYLSSIGYAMTGDSKREQLFWFLRGLTSQNGKSVIFEALEQIMPMYICKASPDTLDKGVDLKKEAASWSNSLRILWLNEITSKKKDDEFLKAICDGTNYKYKKNYAIEAETIPITFKLFGISNHSLNIQSDESMSRRFCMMDFNSQFAEATTEDNYDTKQFVRDKSFNEKLCGEYKYALLRLIFEYSQKYFQEKKLEEYPTEWKQEKTESLESNNEFLSWFNDTFEIGSEYSIARKEIEMEHKAQFDRWKLQDELKRYKIQFTYNAQQQKKVNRVNSKGVFYGFRFKQEIDDTSSTSTSVTDIEDLSSL